MRLLSPQHWAKATGNPEDAGETTNGVRTALHWNQGKNELTIPLGQNDNVSTFKTDPGCDNFHAFCANIQDDNSLEKPKLVANLNAVSDDEDDDIDDDDCNGMDMERRCL